MVNGSLSRVVLVRDAHPTEVVGIIRPAVGLPGGRESAMEADSKDCVRSFDIHASQSGYIRGLEAQVRVHPASGSRDTQSAFRTLTGVRFRPVDESASCIGAGEL